MLRMVTVGGELARRRVPLSEFEYPSSQNDRVKEVIQHFSAARLLVEGQDPDGMPYVEPAHDALVRGWQKLLAWKQEQEEGLILQRRLTPAAEEWEDVTIKKQPKGVLSKAEPVIDWIDRRFYTAESFVNKAIAQVVRKWKQSQQQQERLQETPVQFLWTTNPYLDVLNQQLQSTDGWFNQVESEFVQESVLQRRKNTSWRWRIATGVILGLSALTIAALIGQRNAQIGQVQASRQAAEASLQTKQELDALISALRAGKSLETLIPFGFFKPDHDLTLVHKTLSDAIHSQELSRLDLASIVRKENYRLKEIFFTPDNRLVAVFAGGSELGEPFRAWDIETGEILQNSDNISGVGAGVGSSLRKTNALSSDDKQKLGSMNTGEFLIDPTKRLLVGVNLGNGQGSASYKILDRNQNRDFIPEFVGYLQLSGGAGGISVISNFDGSKLATVDAEGIVHVWRVGEKNENPVKILKDANIDVPAPNVESNFSDSQNSGVAGRFEKIRREIVEDLINNRKYSNNDAEAWVSNAKIIFSQNKKMIFILGGFKGRGFYLWDLESQKELKEVRNRLPTDAHYEIQSASFSPDDNLLAIADGGELRLWNIEKNQLLDKPFQGDADCNSSVSNMVFSRDSQLVATVSTSTSSNSTYICLRNLSGYQLAKFRTDSLSQRLNFSRDSKILFNRKSDSNQIVEAWRIESFDELMARGCDLVRGYLNAPNSDISESDRHLCDDVSSLEPNESVASAILDIPPLPCDESSPQPLRSQQPGYYKDGEYYEDIEKFSPPDDRLTLIFPSGDRYDGEFKDGKRNGCGTYTFADGNRYIGEFRNDNFNGLGEYFEEESSSYRGEFEDGKYQGIGELKFEDGDIYRGEFEDGQCHGSGTLTLADGTTKTGEWQNGSLVGGSPSDSCNR